MESKQNNINEQDGLGVSRLHLACQYDNVEKVRELVDKGAIIDILDERGFTPLHNAIKYSNLNVLRFLIDAGADIHFKDPRYSGGYMHHAAQSMNISVLETLIELGVPINQKDNNGWTPFWFALGSENPELVKWFLNNGADYLSKSPQGYTPLEASEDNPEINKILCEWAN